MSRLVGALAGRHLRQAVASSVRPPHLVESTVSTMATCPLGPEVLRLRLLIAFATMLIRLLKLMLMAFLARLAAQTPTIDLQRGRQKPRAASSVNWNRPQPGHSGDRPRCPTAGRSLAGPFAYEPGGNRRVHPPWTDTEPLLAREQSLVLTGLEAIAKQLPFLVLGIGSDSDSVFINDTLTEYCADRGIEFTRSRAYRKNDQAWVEQKNGAVIRRFLGHERYSGQVAGQTIAHLHGVMRLYVNYSSRHSISWRKPATARWLPSAPWREEPEQVEGKPRARAPHTWRTRKDPFEGVWCDVLGWLQEDLDTSAVALLGRLQETEPDRFSRAHLRTLQRRVQQWRGIMADKLVYAASEATLPDPGGIPEIALVAGDPKS